MNFNFFSVVLPSAHAQGNNSWLLGPAELPRARIRATTPLPYKDLDSYGVQTAPVKFPTEPNKNFISVV